MLLKNNSAATFRGKVHIEAHGVAEVPDAEGKKLLSEHNFLLEVTTPPAKPTAKKAKKK